jgi:hypothetical protein
MPLFNKKLKNIEDIVFKEDPLNEYEEVIYDKDTNQFIGTGKMIKRKPEVDPDSYKDNIEDR